MRIISTLACLCFISPVAAEEFNVNSKVINAVIFNNGASVTRSANLELPVGRHRLTVLVRERLPDVRFNGTGKISILATETGNAAVSIPAEKSDALRSLEAAFETAKAALRSFDAQVETTKARQTAAELRLEFLKSLVSGKGLAASDGAQVDAAALLDVLSLVDAQAIAALAKVSEVKTELSALLGKRQEIQNEVGQAQDAVQRATPPDVRYIQMVLDVSVSEAFSGTLITEGLSQQVIHWRPTYRLDLAQTGDSGILTILRKAVIETNNTESWDGVGVVLSTASFGAGTQTWEPRSQLRGLRDPKQARKMAKRLQTMAVAPAPMLESVGDALEQRGPILQGQTLLFDLGKTNDLHWNVNYKQFVLDSFSFPVELYGLANAKTDSTAFLYTDFTNETGGIILRGDGLLYRDGALISEITLAQMTPGAKISLGFGPLLGMQIKHNILSTMEGESGFITSSTETERKFETVVSSKLDYPIMLKLLDVVPTSENEDLVITMQASPKPSETNRKGQRGVLEWALDMSAQSETTVKFSYQMKWPKDKQLTYR